MATSLIDVQSARDAGAPVAPAPATPLPAVPTGVQVTSALKITAKLGTFFGGPCWFNPIQFTVAGDHVTVTGVYRPRDLPRRIYWWIGFMLTAFAVAVLGGLLIDRSAEQSTEANLGVAIFIGGVILALAAAARLMVVSLRETRKAKQQTPRTHVFPGSAVTFVKLERFGSPVLLVFLLIFGGLLPGYLVWRFLFTRMRGLRITAPFNPEKPSDPETYRLAAKKKEEAAALAQALLVDSAKTG